MMSRTISVVRGILLAGAVAASAALALGYFSFGDGVQQARPSQPLPEADAVVALTGGSAARLTSAMTLLKEGRGRRLLITGVNPGTPAADVHALLSPGAAEIGETELIGCCVDLGRNAEDTLGNASETAAWARRNGFTRLIIVTDDYHMPRSLRELAIAMPHAALTPFPVRTLLMETGAWRHDLGAAAVLAGEYLKYLMIRAREAFLSPTAEAARPPRVEAAHHAPPDPRQTGPTPPG
jgi:uncharacterized SAM-binding protein YcdF (DUF218 family)